MAKPPFRDYDDHPRRNDDIKIKAFGIELEANGKMVILMIIAIAALTVAVWGIFRNEEAHAAMWRAVERQTCVLTLNEQERKEYRTEGKYCPPPRAVYFRSDHGTSTTRDERDRFRRSL